MTGERQRRTLNKPSQQPETEIAVKAPQAVEVDSALINPHALSDRPLAGGAHRKKRHLIGECEPVIRPRIAVRCVGSRMCPYRTHQDCRGSAAGKADPF